MTFDFQPVKNEWGESATEDSDYLYYDDFFNDDKKKKKKVEQPRKRGRPKKSEVSEDWALLYHEFVCYICSATVTGFHEAVQHMNENHKQENETPEKVFISIIQN